MAKAPRSIARVPTAADIDRQFIEHVRRTTPPDWDAAVHDLDALSDAEIREHLRDLVQAELEALQGAAWSAFGMAGGRISGPIAERLFRLAVERRSWADAGTRLQGLDTDTVTRLLAALDPDDLMHLDDEALKVSYPAISALALPIRAAGEPRRLEDLDRRYHDAVSRKAWTDAAKLLDTYPDADIQRLARAFTSTEDLQALEVAAVDQWCLDAAAGIDVVLGEPPHAERIVRQRLEADWEAAIKAEDFRQLVILGARFPKADADAHLKALYLTSLDGMVAAVLHEPFLAPLLYPQIVLARREKQRDMAKFALGKNQFGLVFLLLGEMVDDDANAFVDGLTGPEFTLLQPLALASLDAAGAAARRFVYRGYLPALATAHPAVASGLAGVAGDPSVAVPGGGTVTTHANDSGGAGWFGQDYQGPNAQSVGWIQFLEREAEKFDSDGTSLGFDTSAHYYAQGQAEERHFGSPDKPAWTVDTVGGALPYYDSPSTAAISGGAAGAAGVSDASAAQQAMWDMPGPHAEVALPAFKHAFFAPDVAKVIIRMRFVQYMTNGQAVVMKTAMTVTWTYDEAKAKLEAGGGAGVARVNTPGAAVAYTKIDPEHYEALVRRFPRYTFLRHD